VELCASLDFLCVTKRIEKLTQSDTEKTQRRHRENKKGPIKSPFSILTEVIS